MVSVQESISNELLSGNFLQITCINGSQKLILHNKVHYQNRIFFREPFQSWYSLISILKASIL